MDEDRTRYITAAEFETFARHTSHALDQLGETIGSLRHDLKRDVDRISERSRTPPGTMIAGASLVITLVGMAAVLVAFVINSTSDRWDAEVRSISKAIEESHGTFTRALERMEERVDALTVNNAAAAERLKAMERDFLYTHPSGGGHVGN